MGTKQPKEEDKDTLPSVTFVNNVFHSINYGVCKMGPCITVYIPHFHTSVCCGFCFWLFKITLKRLFHLQHCCTWEADVDSIYQFSQFVSGIQRKFNDKKKKKPYQVIDLSPLTKD